MVCLCKTYVNGIGFVWCKTYVNGIGFVDVKPMLMVLGLFVTLMVYGLCY